MEELIYTDSKMLINEDGYEEKYVYVPQFGEWMTEEEFAFQKACYDPAMEDARRVEIEHGGDDFYDMEDEDYDDEEFEDEGDDSWDYSSMTRDEAMKDYLRTGVNHSNYNLNDLDELNRLLGFKFFNTKK